ncbi:MAG: hypothetical protein V1493_00700 [Candidatus Diapherotrites archaeon]
MGLEESISRHCLWLKTMKQKGGYGGPVAHYWSDSLQYTGPATDWRYQGLIEGFLSLYEKTGQKEFLAEAIACGDFIAGSTGPDGSFHNDFFEDNPSFGRKNLLHDAAADIGLLLLSRQLKKEGLASGKYLGIAMKNFEGLIMPLFFDEKEKAFRQYPKSSGTKENLFVPNKICTAAELLLLLSEYSGNQKYLKIADASMQKVLGLQNRSEPGGIFQSDTKDKIITFYVARCIPALVKMHEATKREEYKSAAESAAEFVKKMLSKEGFDFGFVFSGEKEGYVRLKCPVFVAGSADIIFGLKAAGQLKASEEKKLSALLRKGQDKSGGYRTALGLEGKDNPEFRPGKPSWKDVLHVVGWNDKVLRFNAAMLEKNSIIEGAELFEEDRVECSDAIYSETAKEIRVSGMQGIVFEKGGAFQSNIGFLKKSFYYLGNEKGIFPRLNSKLFRLGGK